MTKLDPESVWQQAFHHHNLPQQLMQQFKLGGKYRQDNIKQL